MKTVKEIRCAVMAHVWQTNMGLDIDSKEQDQILREWAESIIDECADKAEMEEWPDYCGEGESSYTIDRSGILKVKEQLK